MKKIYIFHFIKVYIVFKAKHFLFLIQMQKCSVQILCIIFCWVILHVKFLLHCFDYKMPIAIQMLTFSSIQFILFVLSVIFFLSFSFFILYSWLTYKSYENMNCWIVWIKIYSYCLKKIKFLRSRSFYLIFNLKQNKITWLFVRLRPTYTWILQLKKRTKANKWKLVENW